MLATFGPFFRQVLFYAFCFWTIFSKVYFMPAVLGPVFGNFYLMLAVFDLFMAIFV